MTEAESQGIKLVFYRPPSGREPVREVLKAMQPASKRRIGEDLKVVQLGWPIGMPLVRPLGRGLFEVRSTVEEGEFRTLFSFHGDSIVLLHGFIKKDQRTRRSEIDLAISRRKDLES